jgi:hypothetical protein
MPTDQSGQQYFDVENLRATALPQTWASVPGIRIQAYKGAGNSLFQGAEIPIKDGDTAYRFVRAVMQALESAGI